MSSYNLILCFVKTGISKRCDFGVVLTQKKCIYKNREVCVKSLRQILGILRILAKKNYCAVIASHRRSNLSIIILISPSVIPTKVGIQIFVPLLLEGTF